MIEDDIDSDEDDEEKEWIDEMGMYYSTLEDALDEIIKTKYDLDVDVPDLFYNLYYVK